MDRLIGGTGSSIGEWLQFLTSRSPGIRRWRRGGRGALFDAPLP